MSFIIFSCSTKLFIFFCDFLFNIYRHDNFILEHGMAINLAGGTHHAHHNFGSGFTVINDLAVTARRAIQLKGLRSVLIFDLDVHQGDGTASIFANDEKVFTVSIHCEVNFPFRKEKSNLDVGLPAGTTDEDYMIAVKKALQEAIDICNPDLVIYDAGTYLIIAYN